MLDVMCGTNTWPAMQNLHSCTTFFAPEEAMAAVMFFRGYWSSEDHQVYTGAVKILTEG